MAGSGRAGCPLPSRRWATRTGGPASSSCSSLSSIIIGGWKCRPTPSWTCQYRPWMISESVPVRFRDLPLLGLVVPRAPVHGAPFKSFRPRPPSSPELRLLVLLVLLVGPVVPVVTGVHCSIAVLHAPVVHASPEVTVPFS